jgi:RNA polymerase sigma factor (sigma-70 family)
MESYRLLYAAVNKLFEKQSRRLLLHFEDNLTHRQIANLEGVNRATVSRSIEAALKQLQKYLVD